MDVHTEIDTEFLSGSREGRKPGPVGVAPAARLATAAPGGFGSPAAVTTNGRLQWLDATGRAGRNACARGSEKVCPSRGRHGPGDTNRHDGALQGEARRALSDASPPQGGDWLNKVRLAALHPPRFMASGRTAKRPPPAGRWKPRIRGSPRSGEDLLE
jgi:hypothetical protein